MMDLFLVLLGITLLFFVLLFAKSFLKKEFCVVCASVFLMGFFLLISNYFGTFQNKILLGILIGESTLGIFYLLQKKMEIFRLPLILTLILVAYTLLEGFSYGFTVLILLGFLWVLFYFVFLFRKKKNFRNFVNKLVECCKNF